MNGGMKPSAVIWFTGVISKYNVADVDIQSMKINSLLYSKLTSKYNLICIISVPDEQVKQRYMQIINENHLTDSKYVFISYQQDFDEMLTALLSQNRNITTYIDYSKVRLAKAAKYLKNTEVLHLSQLID